MIAPLFGTLLALVLGALVLTALVISWKRPYLALPILVGGMAVHNAALMLLLGTGMPSLVVRGLQVWKEALIALLLLKLASGLVSAGLRPALSTAFSTWRSSRLVVRILDSGVVLFAAMLLIYTAVPLAARDSGATLTQRLLELRVLEMLPLLYMFGRVWPPVDLRSGLGAVIAIAVVVTLVGLFELFFVSTRTWLDLGVLKFDSWLGFNYTGPGRLPDNFFLGTYGGLLRRMVSTYVSPLGIAYTCILVIPAAFMAAVSAGTRKRSAWLALVLVVAGVAFSLTRLALLCIAVEAIVLLALRLHRTGMLASAAIVAATAFGLLVYPSFGPMVDENLADVRPPLGAQILSVFTGSGGGSVGGQPANISADVINALATGDDSSIQAHIGAIGNGLRFVGEHPLGVGLGTSVSRYGGVSGPGESALFAIAGDIGLLGLLLFVALYGGLVLVGLTLAWLWREDAVKCALGAVVGVGGLALAPIVVTSQVWSNFSVTFLFWWAAGSAVTVLVKGLEERGHQDA